MTSNADWNAWIEKGWVLWHWSVQRDRSGPRPPREGLTLTPSRGDFLTGCAFTEDGARTKAREWLANRIAWSSPKPDRRQFVTLDGGD